MEIAKEDIKKYFAELLGTFVLVFIGCGSAVLAGGRIGSLGISLAFGLSVLAMVYAIGHISGCHINPAITVAMLVAKKIGSRDAAFYIVFQCVGAIIAAGVILAIASGQPNYEIDDGLGQNGYGDESPTAGTNANGTVVWEGYSLTSAFAAEVVLTFIFLMVIFGATARDAPDGFAGLPIGLALVFIHLVSIPITGTSVNPARSLGPALFVGGDALVQLWLFITAPILGAIIAALAWTFLFQEQEGLTLEAKMDADPKT